MFWPWTGCTESKIRWVIGWVYSHCISSHPKFRIVCLDTAVLHTAIAAIKHAVMSPSGSRYREQVSCCDNLAAEDLSVHCSLPRVYLVGSWCSGKKELASDYVTACVVKAKFRLESSEESGEYAGFKPAEIDWPAIVDSGVLYLNNSITRLIYKLQKQNYFVAEMFLLTIFLRHFQQVVLFPIEMKWNVND